MNICDVFIVCDSEALIPIVVGTNASFVDEYSPHCYVVVQLHVCVQCL